MGQDDSDKISDIELNIIGEYENELIEMILNLDNSAILRPRARGEGHLKLFCILIDEITAILPCLEEQGLNDLKCKIITEIKLKVENIEDQKRGLVQH